MKVAQYNSGAPPQNSPNPPLDPPSPNRIIYIPIGRFRRQDSKYVISNQFNMCRPKIAFVPASWMRAWYLTRWDHWDQSIFWHVSSKSYASYTLLQQATKKNGSCMTYGLPTDAIDVVKDLYTEACTKIRWPSGEHTESIQVKRGTIQGETFPPLLFLIYMEPLLQWLHRGVGGYEHGCTKDMRPQTDLERLTNRISSG